MGFLHEHTIGTCVQEKRIRLFTQVSIYAGANIGVKQTSKSNVDTHQNLLVCHLVKFSGITRTLENIAGFLGGGCFPTIQWMAVNLHLHSFAQLHAIIYR